VNPNGVINYMPLYVYIPDCLCGLVVPGSILGPDFLRHSDSGTRPAHPREYN
jgi:hypothetical protein